MNIVFSPHFYDNNQERKIEKDKIIDTLLHPERVIPDRKNRLIAQKRFYHRLLRVVHVKTHNTYIVITAYYTTRISHYEH